MNWAEDIEAAGGIIFGLHTLWEYDDGGRVEAGYKDGEQGDCVCRAIAIATQTPYKVVYDLINEYAKKERRQTRSSARNGVFKNTERNVILKYFGWKYHPRKEFGRTIHIRPEELPKGRIICCTPGHLFAAIDGMPHDNACPSVTGKDVITGYYSKD